MQDAIECSLECRIVEATSGYGALVRSRSNRCQPKDIPAVINAYLYSRCSTCRTAESILQESGRPFAARDLFKDKLSRTELADLFTSIGKTPTEMLSTRSIPYRDLGLAEKKPGDAELLDLMAEYPALIRRPIVVIDGNAQVGLNQPALKSALGMEKDNA